MDKDGGGIVDEEEFAGVMKLIRKDGEKNSATNKRNLIKKNLLTN